MQLYGAYIVRIIPKDTTLLEKYKFFFKPALLELRDIIKNPVKVKYDLKTLKYIIKKYDDFYMSVADIYGYDRYSIGFKVEGEETE